MNDKTESTPKNKWKEFAKRQEDETDVVEEISASDDGEEASQAATLEFPSRQQLEDQLTAMERQMAEYKEKTLAIQAEMENLRRRTAKEVQDAHKFGKAKLLEALLPVMDSLSRGLEGAANYGDDPKIQSMREGISLTLELLESTLTKFGVETINPEKGDAFNPECHEAMSIQEDSKAKSSTILQVLQRGYSLHGRVLRAAMVIVAK